MYRSAKYPTDHAVADAFAAQQRHGYLIATPPGGHPQVSVLPFVKQGETIEVHCVRGDSTLAALEANPLVTFFVNDFLAFTRHDWVDPNDAGRATLNFRAIAYACRASVTREPAEIAAGLARLVASYEPDASGYQPLGDSDFYHPRLNQLALVYLQVLDVDAKFKVGPAGPTEMRRNVVASLRGRDEPGDTHAADVIEATLPQDASG
jgi:predicted FMN-binding regulatory protein PaiB